MEQYKKLQSNHRLNKQLKEVKETYGVKFNLQLPPENEIEREMDSDSTEQNEEEITYELKSKIFGFILNSRVNQMEDLMKRH